MEELTSTAAALEDSGAFVRTEEELSAEVHYGSWKALKGDCQDLFTNARGRDQAMLPLHGLTKWKMSSHKARLPPGAAISLLVLQRLDSQLWRCRAIPGGSRRREACVFPQRS